MSWNAFYPVITFANRLVCTPGFAFGPRVIEYYQFIYVASGFGRVHIQDRHYEAGPGDLFHYGSDIAHYFCADENSPFVLYGIHYMLNGTLPENGKMHSTGATTLVQDTLYKVERPNRLSIGDAGSGLEIPEHWNDGATWIEAYFRRLVDQWNKEEISAHLLNRSLFTQFMLELKERYTSQGQVVSSRQTMSGVMEGLKRNAAMPYDRNWLKEWTLYHENYASRLFHQQFGLSPHRYFMEQKIQLAKELLAETDHTVGEIADQLHMSSIHYFSLFFKQCTGYAPSDYRKLRRNI